jgi:hypothetical protein
MSHFAGRIRIRTAGQAKIEDLENAMGLEKPVHLYWVTVPDDPSEDWFVFATQAPMARRFFAEYEGFETSEAEARLVERNVRLRTVDHPQTPSWAKLSDLEALGFEILSRTPHLRSARKGGETFVEGYLQSEIMQTRDDLAEAVGRGRPHGTLRQRRPN